MTSFLMKKQHGFFTFQHWDFLSPEISRTTLDPEGELQAEDENAGLPEATLQGSR